MNNCEKCGCGCTDIDCAICDNCAVCRLWWNGGDVVEPKSEWKMDWGTVEQKSEEELDKELELQIESFKGHISIEKFNGGCNEFDEIDQWHNWIHFWTETKFTYEFIQRNVKKIDFGLLLANDWLDRDKVKSIYEQCGRMNDVEKDSLKNELEEVFHILEIQGHESPKDLYDLCILGRKEIEKILATYCV